MKTLTCLGWLFSNQMLVNILLYRCLMLCSLYPSAKAVSIRFFIERATVKAEPAYKLIQEHIKHAAAVGAYEIDLSGLQSDMYLLTTDGELHKTCMILNQIKPNIQL